jgi:hypothetical protein
MPVCGRYAKRLKRPTERQREQSTQMLMNGSRCDISVETCEQSRITHRTHICLWENVLRAGGGVSSRTLRAG